MTIKILPSQISDQIAAGEVVERPASVVKELVENSLDAESTFIDIYIEEGGVKKIEIRDDGIGMVPDDLEKSILRHATSKIETIDDVFSIQSFGFRGEALAAIAAVSDFTITSRTEAMETAQTLGVQFGSKKPLEESGAPIGTTVLIEDLFGSVPARKKYLRSERVEFKAIYREVTAFALANPSVGFLFRHNEKVIFDIQPSSSADRVGNLLSMSEGLVPVDTTVSSMRLQGFLSKPDKAQKSRNHQYLFVNGRHVEDKRIGFAIRDAYTQTCGLDKALHPPFVLFLDIDPLLVDVNVHPRKTEVAFSDPRDVFSFMSRSTRNTLGEFSGGQMYNVPQRNFGAPTPLPSSQTSFSTNSSSPSFSQMAQARDAAPGRSFDEFVAPQFISHDTEPKEAVTPTGDLRLVGQVAQKYIVAEADEGLFIFDQHALHERIRFEMLVEQVSKKKVEIQPLLLPQLVKLTPDLRALLEEHKQELEELGLSLTFVESGLEVHALPQLLDSEPLDFLFQDMARYFEEEKTGEHTLERMLRIILEFKSCRGSVKFGDRLEPAEMKLLLEQYKTLEYKLLCPHGRPNHVFWRFEDLDKSFYR